MPSIRVPKILFRCLFVSLQFNLVKKIQNLLQLQKRLLRQEQQINPSYDHFRFRAPYLCPPLSKLFPFSRKKPSH